MLPPEATRRYNIIQIYVDHQHASIFDTNQIMLQINELVNP